MLSALTPEIHFFEIQGLIILSNLKISQKNTVRLPGLWAGLSKGDCYLPGIHPTVGTSLYEYIDSIYTGSHSDQMIVKIECQFSKGLYKIIEMNTHLKIDRFYMAIFFLSPFLTINW